MNYEKWKKNPQQTVILVQTKPTVILEQINFKNFSTQQVLFLVS